MNYSRKFIERIPQYSNNCTYCNSSISSHINNLSRVCNNCNKKFSPRVVSYKENIVIKKQ
jgi:hypothetical protein